jgi:hypothetical protein
MNSPNRLAADFAFAKSTLRPARSSQFKMQGAGINPEDPETKKKIALFAGKRPSILS